MSDALQSLNQQMRVMADLAAGRVAPEASRPLNEAGEDFATVLKNAVNSVSDAQNASQAKAQAFLSGDTDASLEEVMLSVQKANLSFQTMVAVRNRLVDAYKDITNLQV